MASTEGGPEPAEPGAADRPGDFERYALIAALTLVVACLLVWDTRRGARSGPPPQDRTARIRLGGGTPPVPSRAQPPRPAGARPAVVPDAPPPPPSPPAPATRTYTVRDGDTLSGIAQRELGSSGRAREIASLNSLADPDRLKAGQVLQLPLK